MGKGYDGLGYRVAGALGSSNYAKVTRRAVTVTMGAEVPRNVFMRGEETCWKAVAPALSMIMPSQFLAQVKCARVILPGGEI